MNARGLKGESDTRGRKGLFLVHAGEIDARLERKSPVAKQLGTNLILQDFGISGETTNELVLAYGKDVVKSASRIAYERVQEGIPVDFYYLVEVVDRLKEYDTRRLVINKQIDPLRILLEYDITNSSSGLKILTPKESNVTLEEVMSRPDIQQFLSGFGLKPTYNGREVVLFECSGSKLVH